MNIYIYIYIYIYTHKHTHTYKYIRVCVLNIKIVRKINKYRLLINTFMREVWNG